MRNESPITSQRRGISLAATALLLVIIGLISGAILFSHELMQHAQARFAASQIETFNQAVLAFKGKHNCLPGDCMSLENLKGTGNGDGNIGCAESDLVGCFAVESAAMGEYAYFWHQLSAAGFIDGQYAPYSPGDETANAAGTASPAVVIAPARIIENAHGGWAVRGAANVFDGKDIAALPKHHFELGQMATLQRSAVAMYSAHDMYLLDTKLDDGLPFEGTARAWSMMHILQVSAYIASAGSGGEEAALCVDTDPAPAIYNIDYKGLEDSGFCSLLIKAAF